MAHVISFANQKGGVGKSTLCIQLAHYLSQKKGKRVLVIDMDAQGNTSSRMALSDGEPIPFEGTETADLFDPDYGEIKVMQTGFGIDLIHSSKNSGRLHDVESLDLSFAEYPGQHLEEVFPNYDYVIIDCPPSLGRKLIAALLMSTYVVCPVKLSGFAVDGIDGLLNTIYTIQTEFNEGLRVLGIIINDQDRSVSHEKAYEALKKTVPNLLFKNRIMHRPPLDTATTEGLPVWDLRYGHVAAKEVEKVLEELFLKVEA